MSKLLLLVNYGGPTLGKEKEYLRRLFSDEVLFPLPKPLRVFTGNLIATLRWRETRKILSSIGGKSPLLEQTLWQAKALAKLLKGWDVKVAMRYSHPLLEQALKNLGEVHRLVIFPLFPHYSFATYLTVERVVKRLHPKAVFTQPFYNCEAFIRGWVSQIETTLKEKKISSPFLVFSAHSLPLYLVKKYRDPYPLQVEESAKLIAQSLSLPFKVSYQSRVGPLKWLSPSTEEVIKELSRRGVKELVVVPISFTAENSETLQEIDQNYQNLAKSLGIKDFIRVKIPYDHPWWIECFKENFLKALG
ncbi:MAG TPA: ferrochelatase [Aquifex aeolicus]|uniref:Ferrochelatase n=1 Tax=Aquifex aeolicus TaxID=63363 RepID=A0A9D0YR63_AQUAO|nr:ferrochelatase [Aquifex aeolicus]